MKNNMFDWDKICNDADYCMKNFQNLLVEELHLLNDDKKSREQFCYYQGFLHGVLYFRDNLKINLEKI